MVHVIRKLSREDGDAVVARWNPADAEQVAVAAAKYAQLVGDGFLTFVASPAAPPEQVREFNPLAAEILAVPQFKGG